MTSRAHCNSRALSPSERQNRRRVADRGQWVAKLVRERCQELVFAPVGFAQRLLSLLERRRVHECPDRSPNCVLCVQQRDGVAVCPVRRSIRETKFELLIRDGPTGASSSLHRQLQSGDEAAVDVDLRSRRSLGCRGAGLRCIRIERCTQHSGRRGIARDHATLAIVRDPNRGGCRPQERLELQAALLLRSPGFLQRLLSLLALRDVHEILREATLRQRIVPDEKPTPPNLVIIFELDVNLLLHAATQRSKDRRVHDLRKNLLEGPAEHVFASQITGALELAVHIDETPRRIDAEEAVGDALERGGEAPAALALAFARARVQR